MDILDEIQAKIPINTQIIAVSKHQSLEAIKTLYEKKHLIYGESKVQELLEKYEQLPKDIQWHFIGHLQTNKVKYIVPFISLIHGVDSLRLLKEINKRSKQHNKITACLLQVHIASEETKFGFTFEELKDLLEQEVLSSLKNIEIRGLMGMASNTDDENKIRSEFRSLHDFFIELKEKYFKEKNSFKELSMGMSSDYKIAVEEGSTMIRIGSLLFGDRVYI